MLVLTRKSNQAIQIGNDIEIKILAMEGEQVKIGIIAPKFVEIHRKEIITELQAENSEAANTPENILNLIEKKSKK